MKQLFLFDHSEVVHEDLKTWALVYNDFRVTEQELKQKLSTEDWNEVERFLFLSDYLNSNMKFESWDLYEIVKDGKFVLKDVA